MATRDPVRFNNSQTGTVADVGIDPGSQGLPGPAGPAGPAGPQGPTGPAGEDFEYVHDQPVASSVWTINHNGGKYPTVVIVDTSTRTVRGSITYPTSNQVVVTFSVPFSGQAFLN